MMEEKFICNRLSKKTKYEYILYSTSYESSVNDKKYLKKIIKECSITGYVLVDLLLSKGDSFNRFVELYIEDKMIKEIIVRKEICRDIKIMSERFYQEHNSLLNKKNSFYYLD